MQTDEAIEAFYSYIGLAIDYYKRKKEWTNKDLAIQADLSESFVKQANTGSRHYNAYRIWKIASLLDVPVSYLYPPSTNDDSGLKQYQEIYPQATKKDFENFMHLLSD
jgi:transcriptional regulator with XRE-family HTH domain